MKSNFKKHLKYNFIYLFLLVSTFGFGQEAKLMLPIGHTGWVKSADFSPDGKNIVTASEDYTAKIWDVESGKIIADLVDHSDPVNSAIFSPDGKNIITVSDKVKIWNVESGRLIADLTAASPYFTYHFVAFSPDGNKIVTNSSNNAVKIWDVKNGKPIAELTGHLYNINSASFSSDGRKVVTASVDRTVKIWDAQTGKLLADLTGHSENISSAIFSFDAKKIVTASTDGTAKIWDAESGKIIDDLLGHTMEVLSVIFSSDGLNILSASRDKTAKIWNVHTGKIIADLKGHTDKVNSAKFSLDGKKIVTASDDNTAKIWNVQSGQLIADLKGQTKTPYSAIFSPDGKKILTVSSNNNAIIWDVESGKPIVDLSGHTKRIFYTNFSTDGLKIVTVSENIAKIWNVESGKLIGDLEGRRSHVNSARFSPDGKKIVFSDDYTAKIWDIESGKLVLQLKEMYAAELISATFSSDGKKIVTVSDDRIPKMWDVESGEFIRDLISYWILVDYTKFSYDSKMIATAAYDKPFEIYNVESGERISILTGYPYEGYGYASFSLDGKKIVTVLDDYIPKIWDVESGKLIAELEGHTHNVYSAIFSPDGKKIVTASDDNTAKIWNAQSGQLFADLKGHTTGVYSATFSPDGKKIVTTSGDETAKIWDSESGSLLYTFLTLDKSDYLILDRYGRYDGSQRARDYLYFTCGTEIIDLTQMKDALYVPGLVEKIMSGQDINYPKLSDLDICDALPLVEQIENTESNYFYKITSRKLGLEYVEVYVNGKKVMNVNKDELREENGLFYLKLKEADVKKHFINDVENKVNVVAIARQSGNELRSRGANVVVVDEKKENLVVPKLFAVMIGINDYKDQALNLNYPVKDANELGKAIELSAQKLLGKDNVIMYSINSEVKAGNGYTTPEKEGIKRALADIGKKAQPEDLIMLFFAGHGVMQSGDEKLFTFLTAEASQSNQIGITTKELQNWLSYEGPNKILANKTILIFDACNSGQATQELIAMARSDDDTRRIRQVEDLKDKSGMFILAASAPNQAAYELPQYEQGLLTYSLLSVLKNNPDILDDSKYLNVQKWFLESEKYLQQLMASLGLKQDAQPFGTANIRIGEVDEDVKRSIQLAVEKPMVICANVLNDATFDDDIGLKSIINARLSEISERGVNQSIVYPRKETENTNKINIRYTLKDQSISCEVRLLKSGETLHTAKITGSKSNIDGLVADIIQEVIKYVK